jgi:diguanylate cyclase (GGDEF)-like protein/PAS domain S-box-containing protein
LGPSNRFDREQSLLDAMSENTVLIDQQGNIVVANKAWCQFSCINNGEPSLCGASNNYLDVCRGGDDNAEAVYQGIRQILSGELDKFERFYPCHGPAEQRWFIVKAAPYPDNQHNIRALISHHNVTTLIERQHRIEAKENRYSTVINSLVEGMIIQNEFGEIETCNEAAETLLGLSKAVMMSQKSLSPKGILFRPDGTELRPEEFPPFISLTHGQTIEGAVVGLTNSSDKISWVKINSQPIFESPESTAYSSVVTTIISVTDELEQNKQLKKIGERLELAVNSANIGIWDWDIKANELIWDDNMFRLYDIKREDFIGVYDAWTQALHPEDAEFFTAHINLALEKGLPFEQDFRIVWPDSTIHIIKPFAIIRRDEDGNPVRMVGANQDVTQLRLAQQALSYREYRLELLIDNLPVGAVSLDGDRITMNTAAEQMTGYDQSDITSVKAWFKCVAAFGSGKLLNQYKNDRQKGFPKTRSFEFRHKSGAKGWLEFNGFLYKEGEAWIITDITDRKRAEHDLQVLAFYDPLTKLPNRAHFETVLNKTLFRARRHKLKFALLLLDIDQFKRINDTYGHPAGDKLLALFAERIKNRLREEDLVARLGGDEFVILIENIKDTTEVAGLSQQLIVEMQKPYQLEDDFVVTVSASIGISLYPSHAKDEMRLLRNADTAMYLAKAKGRNTFCFYSSELTDAVEQRLVMEIELRKAIDLEQFVVYYQPMVDIVSGEVFGAEALVRWQDQNGHIKSPDEFIPVAEETGLITALGKWVLKQACMDMARWIAMGLSIKKISVNFSPGQFKTTNIVSLVLDTMKSCDLPPHFLDIEITENTLVSQLDKMEQVVSTLKKKGVSFSIDDFGTGYSSLTYLKELSFDRIKIDRGFIRDIFDDKNNNQLVRAIINMGHNLNLSVVAEGVETQQQLDFLKLLCCDFYQGYLMSYPLPVKEFEALLTVPPDLKKLNSALGTSGQVTI